MEKLEHLWRYSSLLHSSLSASTLDVALHVRDLSDVLLYVVGSVPVHVEELVRRIPILSPIPRQRASHDGHPVWKHH